MSEQSKHNIDQPPFSEGALTALEVIKSLRGNDAVIQKYKTDPDHGAEFTAIWEEEKNISKPVKTALFFLELKPTEKNADVRRELKKYIIKQGSVLENRNISIVTTEGAASLPKTEISPAPEIKQNTPEITPSIPVAVGDIFKSATMEYTVRGFAPNGGIQYKDSKNGNGTLGVQKFNEEIAKGRLVKQEVIAAPETLATPLERKTTSLPEVTLTLPMGTVVMKPGIEIAKQDNEALYKLITSKVKSDLEGEVEKYQIKATFKNEKNVVFIDIVPTYAGGIVGKKITRRQEWLEKIPEPRKKIKEKIEADHIQIDGITLAIGDALPKNITDIVNAQQKDESARSEVWNIDRVFYQTYPITKEDGKKGIDGGMRMGLTAPDGRKTSVSLGDVRMTLQEIKDKAARAEKKANQAAKATVAPVVAPIAVEKAPEITPAPEVTASQETFDQQAETVRLQKLSTELFAESNKQKQAELLLAVFPEYEALVKQFGPETLMRETMKQLGIEIPQPHVAPTIETAQPQLAPTMEKAPTPEMYTDFIQFKHGGTGAEDFINIGTTITSDTYPAAHAIFTAALAQQGIPASSSIILNKVSVRNEMVDEKKVTVRTAYVTLDNGQTHTILQKDLYEAEKSSQPITTIPPQEATPSVTPDSELAQEVAPLVQEEIAQPQVVQEIKPQEPVATTPEPVTTAQVVEAPKLAPEKTGETQASPEQGPVTEFSTSQVREAIENALETLDEQNKLNSSDFAVRSNGEGGIILTFKQETKGGGFLGLGKPKWNISANMQIKDGAFDLVENNIKLDSKDEDVMKIAPAYKTNIKQVLSNLTQVLLMKNNLSTETHTLGIKDGRILVFKK